MESTKDSIKHESQPIAKQAVISSYSREDVIALLEWLRKGNYHNQGFGEGWAERGSTPYSVTKSSTVLKEFDVFYEAKNI